MNWYTEFQTRYLDNDRAQYDAMELQKEAELWRESYREADRNLAREAMREMDREDLAGDMDFRLPNLED